MLLRRAILSVAILTGCCLLLPLVECLANVVVERNPADPKNPNVLVESIRPEIYYAGPLHQFPARHGMHAISLKMEMERGQHQCYYFILIQGYQLSIFAAALSSDENRFHLMVATSDETFIKKFSDKQSISFTHNVTTADTYEVCLINSVTPKQIMFSALYYQPQRYEEELLIGLEKAAHLANVSGATEASIRSMEMHLNKALLSIRYKPHLYRDYVALRASNTYVQWKSVAFIALMLCSFGATTLFIHYLFHVPKGRVAI